MWNVQHLLCCCIQCRPKEHHLRNVWQGEMLGSPYWGRNKHSLIQNTCCKCMRHVALCITSEWREVSTHLLRSRPQSTCMASQWLHDFRISYRSLSEFESWEWYPASCLLHQFLKAMYSNEPTPILFDRKTTWTVPCDRQAAPQIFMQKKGLGF